MLASKAGKTVSISTYPEADPMTSSQSKRVEMVEAKVADLVTLGARMVLRTRSDDPDDAFCCVVMNDPDGNEFYMS